MLRLAQAGETKGRGSGWASVDTGDCYSTGITVLTLWTVRLACVCYAIAVAAWIRRRRGAARVAWTAGLGFYLLHVAAAFQFHHQWSHAAAYRETARQTQALFGFDWGGGLWFNYVFTAVWAVDAAWLWMAQETYYRRSRALAVAIHGFLAFMFVNGAIVFGSPAMRWVSLAAVAALFFAWRRR